MKNIAMMVLGIGILFAAGCGRNKEAAKHQTDPVRGEWRIVNVNCPEVLAEQNGRHLTFQFHPPHDYGTYSRATLMRMCREVEPGWTIWAERNDRFSFFPPIQKGKEVK